MKRCKEISVALNFFPWRHISLCIINHSCKMSSARSLPIIISSFVHRPGRKSSARTLPIIISSFVQRPGEKSSAREVMSVEVMAAHDRPLMTTAAAIPGARNDTIIRAIRIRHF